MIRKIKSYWFIFIVLLSIFFAILVACDRYGAGVKKGKGFLSKTLLIKYYFPRGIRNIQVGAFDSSQGKEIIILSQKSYLIIDDKTKSIKKAITFKQNDIRPEVINNEDKRSFFIMLRGGGFGDVGLLNEDGEILWKYKRAKGTSPMMDAGDLDHDSKLEFYISDDDGIHKLNASGIEIWKKAGIEGYDIQIFDKGGNIKPCIIIRGYDGNINYLDNTGHVLNVVMPEIKSSGLEIISWPENFNILAKTDYEIIVMSFEGRVIFKHELKKDLFKTFVHLLEIMAIRGIDVKLAKDEKPYLVVLTDFRAALGKTMISVFSPKGSLVYQEMLRNTRGINKLPNEDGSESILIGDDENVWIYSLKKNN